MTPSVAVPAALRQRYRSWLWTHAYQIVPEVGTWRLTGPGGVLFVKVAVAGWYPSPVAEAARLRWARHHVPVPAVVAAGTDGIVSWVVTGGLPGRTASDPELAGDPARLVPVLAHGLREFHARAPVAGCPWDFRLPAALALVRSRVASAHPPQPEGFHPEHAHLSTTAAVVELDRLRPPTEDLVVCHGDYCPPNVLVAGGRVAGYLDLGELGVADRWWDLAVGGWAVTWNYGPEWEALFYEAYGIGPDPARIAFYRLLYDLVS